MMKKKEISLFNQMKKNIYPLITRFKGLGEMPAEQLKQTTMDVQKEIINSNKYYKTESKETAKTEKLF